MSLILRHFVSRHFYSLIALGKKATLENIQLARGSERERERLTIALLRCRPVQAFRSHLSPVCFPLGSRWTRGDLWRSGIPERPRRGVRACRGSGSRCGPAVATRPHTASDGLTLGKSCEREIGEQMMENW